MSAAHLEPNHRASPFGRGRFASLSGGGPGGVATPPPSAPPPPRPRFRLWLLPRTGGIDRNTSYIQRGRGRGSLPAWERDERGGRQVVGARHLSAESSPNTVLPPA
ncbi:hypothetical protein PVAP13_5KG569407 [Panicum virgatum]|uniref:Uncharacterized protein n=1 Tax=Panicum virgatum TaxID=38727 RepID=A0A8T0SW71_PANVG|nr:hypothetical protein PVAP13_5KG569407 [Panicum virgatum]